jgi:hydroxymethylpyrimidine/phosphomethylpyrimidine kinase
MSAETVDVIKARLIPLAHVITPNIPEAEKLSRKAVLDVEVAAEGLLSLGADAVLLKGGHLKGADSTDVLVHTGGVESFSAERVLTANTHGTGCTLSSALAAYLAKGLPLVEAVSAAKDYVTGAIKGADRLGVGHGHGPLDHFWDR